MEKTVLCNLMVCYIKNKDKEYLNMDNTKFYPTDLEKNGYDIKKGKGIFVFKMTGYGHIFKYKYFISFNGEYQTDSLASNSFVNWNEVFKVIQKEHYIGCDECVFKYKYVLSKTCDKIFQLNGKVCEWKGYGGKRGEELKEMSRAIKKELGDAFFRV
jgi:hypothetical protein